MQNNIDNNRIAKNTFYLYIRMIVFMIISLYTSRVVINALGIDDYGIYSVVGGVVILFSFVSNALRNSTQRFVSFYLGTNDIKNVNRVVNMSLQCFLLYAFIIVIIAATVGLWFVSNKLKIPDNREEEAIIVYFISLTTFVVNIFQAPFQATIVSNEKMSFYAIISIFDAIMKLVIVFLLSVSPFDKLITYSSLLFVVSIISLIIPVYYCYKQLHLERPRIIKDRALFKHIFSYAGWSMYSGLSYVGAQQGGNFLINIFGGVAANGAYGIANQATNVLYSFVSNFQSAINPQIVKSFSANQYKEMFQLINRSSYFSYYIFLIMAAPILVGIEFIINIWLGNCPEYAADFCRLLFLYFLVDSIQAPLWMLIGATGKMKIYSLWTGTLTFLNVPIAWLLLKYGCGIIIVFVVKIAINIVISCIRPFYVKHIVPEFSLRDYCNETLKRPLFTTLLVFTVIAFFYFYSFNFHPIILIVFTFLATLIIIWVIGLKPYDRKSVIRMANSRINQIVRKK